MVCISITLGSSQNRADQSVSINNVSCYSNKNCIVKDGVTILRGIPCATV